MSFNLTIDQGNTAAKLALWTRTPDSQCVDVRISREHTADAIARLCNEVDVETAIYASVTTPHSPVLCMLRQRCRKVIELKPGTPIPLRIDYATPNTLGVDRIAAAVGAWSLPQAHGRDILVVDIGTAITYDMVTADARYIGGNIAPGVYMRLRALNRFTARLPMVDPEEGPIPLLGNNTETALRSGAVNGVVAEIEYYRSHLSSDATAVITGGSAHQISERLSFEHTVVDGLVSQGLNNIIRYNESLHTPSRPAAAGKSTQTLNNPIKI